MSRNLPEFPNLDYLKKRAKILLRELQQRNPGAKLTEAQHAIAREYGFASWPKLKAHVESLPRPNHDRAGGSLFPRFTEKAKRAIFHARYFARDGNKRIEAEHLFLGMVQADGELLNRLLPGQFQARPAPEPEEIAQLKSSLAKRVPQVLEQMRRTTAGEKLSTAADSPLSGECRRIVEQAGREADGLRHQKIGTAHFLLAFLREEVARETPILTGILSRNGIRLDAARDEIARFLSDGPL